jgi:energy-coupling factor transport system ATP-binding protein
LAADVERPTPLPDPPRSAGTPILEVRDLTAGYGPRVVLRDVRLDAATGDVIALMGRNGAGKTTLLRCLAGLHDGASGTVRVDGSAPEPGKDVALCPQTPEGVLFRDSVREEIETTLRWSSVNDPPERWLSALGIEALSHRHPRDLSAGQRLLVAVAAVATTGARVLLLDEPTRGLDQPSKERLVSFLRGFAAENCVVLATHDVELAAEVATRVVMLAGGEVIAEGTASDVLGDSAVFAPQMARVFGREWMTPDAVISAFGGAKDKVGEP